MKKSITLSFSISDLLYKNEEGLLVVPRGVFVSLLLRATGRAEDIEEALSFLHRRLVVLDEQEPLEDNEGLLTVGKHSLQIGQEPPFFFIVEEQGIFFKNKKLLEKKEKKSG